VVWALAGSKRLHRSTRRVLGDPSNDALISAAAVWEIAIKRAIGKLHTGNDVREQIRASGFGELDITFAHAEAAGALPLHHRDPFDRLLIAQARIEGLVVATHDPAFDLYDVETLKV